VLECTTAAQLTILGWTISFAAVIHLPSTVALTFACAVSCKDWFAIVTAKMLAIGCGRTSRFITFLSLPAILADTDFAAILHGGAFSMQAEALRCVATRSSPAILTLA
jgi:hypothetical protein